MKSFVILVFSFLLSFVTHSQELEWIIKPSITEVDEIAVLNTAKPLVRVKKGALYGVKNLNNKLIIPIVHKELNISLDQKLIYSGDINSKRTAVYTITIKGDTLETNLNAPHQRHWRRTNKSTNPVLAKFAMENDLKVMEYENEKARVRYKLSAKNNKFSIDNITLAKPLGKDYIFLMINHRKGYVYDRFGNIAYHDPRMSSLTTNGRGLYAANNMVLDTALNVIFKGNKEHPELLKNYPLFTVQSLKNGKPSYRLVNDKGETLV